MGSVFSLLKLHERTSQRRLAKKIGRYNDNKQYIQNLLRDDSTLFVTLGISAHKENHIESPPLSQPTTSVADRHGGAGPAVRHPRGRSSARGGDGRPLRLP